MSDRRQQDEIQEWPVWQKIVLKMGPGLVVMGGDSCTKGCEFESRHHILDGHFFTYLFTLLKRRK